MDQRSAGRLKMLVAAGILIAWSGCATLEKGVDFDDSVDFDKYETAAWLTDYLFAPIDSEPISPLTVKRVRQAVEYELLKHGIRVDDSYDADLSIAAVVGARRQLDTKVYRARHRPHGGWCGAACYDVRFVDRTYTAGTLSIDLFDAETGQPVWHGWVQKAITLEDRQHPKRSIDAAVEALFAGFPKGT